MNSLVTSTIYFNHSFSLIAVVLVNQFLYVAYVSVEVLIMYVYFIALHGTLTIYVNHSF